MTTPIKKLKHTHARMTTVLNELDNLEDYENTDYSEIITDYKYITVMLEQRRDRLMRKGKTL